MLGARVTVLEVTSAIRPAGTITEANAADDLLGAVLEVECI